METGVARRGLMLVLSSPSGAGKTTIAWKLLERHSGRRDVVTVFILPPSAPALEERLKFRAEDSKAVVRKRLRGASNEVEHWNEYDYVVINCDVEWSVTCVQSILIAERHRRSRVTSLKQFVKKLQTEL